MRTHDDDWVPLSVIGSHIRAANSEFDPRTYGCAKLVDLMEKTGQFEVKRNEIPVRARTSGSGAGLAPLARALGVSSLRS